MSDRNARTVRTIFFFTLLPVLCMLFVCLFSSSMAVAEEYQVTISAFPVGGGDPKYEIEEIQSGDLGVTILKLEANTNPGYAFRLWLVSDPDRSTETLYGESATFELWNLEGTTVTAQYRCIVTITTDSTLPDAKVGVPYSVSLSADSAEPLNWEWQSDVNMILPPGMSVSHSGTISGTPTDAGNFEFYIIAGSRYGTSLRQFRIRVAPGTVNPTVYTVTFDLAGGDRTGGGELTQTIAEGSSATAPTATRAGYTFDGWDKDFSNVTADMTVTALWTQNEIVVKDPEQYRVTVTYNSDGTLSCKLDMPLAKFDPSKMAGISAAISGLTNPSFGYVGTGGNLVTLTPRAADDPDPLAPPYLRIQGTAADEAALASAELSSLTYWLEGDATTYVQTFAPPLKLADMPTTYTNDPPGEDDNSENENKSSGGGGCTTGVPFGIATLLAAAAAKIAAKRRK